MSLADTTARTVAAVFALLASGLDAQSAVAATDRIHVAIDAEYAPFEFVGAAGEPAGFTVELLREIGVLTGSEFHFAAVNWSEAVAGLADGRFDLVNMIQTAERLERFALSVPHSRMSQAIFARAATRDRITDLEALRGLRVALQADDISFEELVASTDFSRVLVSSKQAGLQLLHEGKVDALFVAEGPGLWLVKQGGMQDIGVAMVDLFPRDYGFAARRGRTELIDKLNRALDTLRDNGKLAEIAARWRVSLPHLFTWWERNEALLLVTGGLLALAALVLGGLTFVFKRRARGSRVELEGAMLQLSTLVEATPDAVLLKDGMGRWLMANRAVRELFQVGDIAVEGRTDGELGELIPAVRAASMAGVEADERVWQLGAATQIEEVIGGPGAGCRWLDVIRTPLFHGDGSRRCLVVIGRDVTARRRAEQAKSKLEERLREAQKMEALGQLAGGVAHDFNNVLTVIRGHAGIMGESPEMSPELRASLRSIDEAAQRASRLTRQLLTFGRRQSAALQRIELRPVIEEFLQLLRGTVGRNLDVQLQCADELPQIDADVGLIEQLLTNLVLNARDAMPDGGRVVVGIGISTAALPPDVRKGTYVSLSVADTGVGIPAEVLPHVFEPFFTTKDVGTGTGLGLAMAYGIVKQHHGWITVDTCVGRGTTFTVHLPACADRVPVAQT